MNRLALRISLLLAALAWATFIALQVRLRQKPQMWILTAGWPAYYTIVVGFAYGMVSVSRRGGPGADVLPGQFRSALNRVYWAASQVAIIVFPLVALLMGVALLIAIR